MRPTAPLLTGCLLVLLPVSLRASDPGAVKDRGQPVSPQAAEFFEQHVRPVLAEKCFSCHGPKRQKAGLRLDSPAALFKGSDSGPVVVKGEPDRSPLIRAVRYDGDTKMPPTEKLPPQAVEALTRWVKMGAPWPQTMLAAGATAADTS